MNMTTTMKNIFLLSLCMGIAIICNSQKTNSSLTNCYSTQELADYKANEPAKYELLLYAIDHATYLSDFDENKHSALKRIDTSIPNPRFTDLEVKIEKVNQYFYAPKLNKVVVVKSEWVLRHEMKNK
jgi:hypothetical protein